MRKGKKHRLKSKNTKNVSFIEDKLKGKRLYIFLVFWMICITVPPLIVSVGLIKYGVGLSNALLSISFVLLVITGLSIGFLKGKFKNYSNPYWILILGLITTFVGFTLSGAFQEIVKDREDQSKLTHRLYALILESKQQRAGLGRTLDDFQTVLFEESKNNDEKEKQFYVRKQFSVYNESDAKDILLSDVRKYTIKQNDREFQDLLISNTGTTSQIYNDLTFKSNNPEEMLHSYFELISLYYHMDERVSILGAELQYLAGQNWDKAKKDLKQRRRENRNFALELINESEETMKKQYPDTNIKVDKNSLLK
ncbi:hypothetical protein M1K46_07950 [Fictibacillus sp. WQ 8-8]|uniref:hypothetical protein n=1 Tax=Fictibacillus sp. WQ 8-8 TaxID=2938788 RepID=UPI00210AE016|nr:hypothetical protein [Fictibacillus sp. WQ 8-8]MCQ6265595.1 hypothetical protein [Fictibacillus sp. WQ 8-8]